MKPWIHDPPFYPLECLDYKQEPSCPAQIYFDSGNLLPLATVFCLFLFPEPAFWLTIWWFGLSYLSSLGRDLSHWLDLISSFLRRVSDRYQGVSVNELQMATCNQLKIYNSRSQPVGMLPFWGPNDPFHRGHLRPSAYQIFTMQLLTAEKLQLWSNFTAGGHHNMSNCIKGSRLRHEGWEPLL